MSEEDCIFCAIVAGEIDSHTVYEDDAVMAFLDANPLVEGHTLIIPKDHHPTTEGMPASVGAAIGRTIAQLTPAIEAAVDADASTVGINNGPAAGQEIEHCHAHIVPRYEDDGGGMIHSIVGSPTEGDHEELAALAGDIQAEI